MRPGRLLGEGRTAEVYEFGEGRVIKLLRPEFDPRMLREEVERTERARAAVAPAPRVHKIVSIDGRDGVVLDRAPGVSLLELVHADPERVIDWARSLARAHARILEIEATGLRDVRDVIRPRVEMAPALAERHRRQVVSVLDSLEGGDRLLHGDFHPSNFFVSGEEEMVIDWSGAFRGPAAADIARTLILLSPESIPPDYTHRDELVRLVGEFSESYREHVLVLVGIRDEEVERWTLPMLAGRLCEEIEWEREPLLRRIDSALRFA